MFRQRRGIVCLISLSISYNQVQYLGSVNIKIASGFLIIYLNDIKKENILFDIVFIDADKTNYTNYYESVIQLIKKDGLIIIDNVLWHGEVADENNNEKFTNIIREFNTHVKNDNRVEQIILPIGDGLTVCRKL